MHRSKSVFISLLLLALLVRVGILLTPDALRADPDAYRALAANLVEHSTFGHGSQPTAYRPPLYPLVLAPTVALGEWSRAAIGLAHLAMGLATVAITYWLAQRWCLGRWSVLAALLVALDPILLAQSALVMTETLATLLAVSSLALLTWFSEWPSVRRGLAAGTVMGLAILCRPTFLPWTALVGVVLLLRAMRSSSADASRSFSRRFVPVAAVFAAIALVLAPWTLRNYAHFSKPIVTTTHGGYTFLLANNSEFYAYLRSDQWNDIWRSDRLDREIAETVPRGTPAEELAADQTLYDRGWQAVRAEPGMFAYASLARVGRLWNPLPHQLSPGESKARKLARWTVAAWYAAEFLLAIVGFVVLGKSSGIRRASLGPLAAILMVVAFTAVHAVFWTDMRMRAPLVPLAAIAAAWGAAALARRICQNA